MTSMSSLRFYSSNSFNLFYPGFDQIDLVLRSLVIFDNTSQALFGST